MMMVVEMLSPMVKVLLWLRRSRRIILKNMLLGRSQGRKLL
jgi:hypothetical protein